MIHCVTAPARRDDPVPATVRRVPIGEARDQVEGPASLLTASAEVPGTRKMPLPIRPRDPLPVRPAAPTAARVRPTGGPIPPGEAGGHLTSDAAAGETPAAVAVSLEVTAVTIRVVRPLEAAILAAAVTPGVTVAAIQVVRAAVTRLAQAAPEVTPAAGVITPGVIAAAIRVVREAATQAARVVEEAIPAAEVVTPGVTVVVIRVVRVAVTRAARVVEEATLAAGVIRVARAAPARGTESPRGARNLL